MNGFLFRCQGQGLVLDQRMKERKKIRKTLLLKRFLVLTSQNGKGFD